MLQCTKEEFEELIKNVQATIWVMDAFVKGYKLEVRSVNYEDNVWEDLIITKDLQFDWINFEYRLKK